MPSQNPPPPRPPPRRIDGPMREREFLEDGEEVTRITDRELVIRAVNSTLRTEHALGVMAAELSALARKVDSRARDEEERQRRRLRESIPDIVAEVVDEITDHGQARQPEKHDSDRVRIIAREEDERARDSDELRAFRDRVKFRWDVTKQILGAAGGGVVLELCRLLVTGHW